MIVFAPHELVHVVEDGHGGAAERKVIDQVANHHAKLRRSETPSLLDLAQREPEPPASRGLVTQETPSPIQLQPEELVAVGRDDRPLHHEADVGELVAEQPEELADRSRDVPNTLPLST